jgi:UDP-glucose 4-epimerase
MKRVCITGGAGFVGSTLADRLSAEGSEVVVIDDFRTGRREFVEDLRRRPGTEIVEGDVLDEQLLERAFAGCDWIFHLQANADVRHGLEHPTVDFQQNTVTTSRVLEAMRRTEVSNLLFASTGSVYGEPEIFPTPENAPFPVQTSLYGASKVAGEALIAAYAAGYGFSGVIGRFVSILGERYTHGHVYDFFCALKSNPTHLRVLGDGKQEKSYLYVQDCVDALLLTARHHQDEPGAHIYNLGTDDAITVDQSVAIITDHMGVSPTIEYSGGKRGWIGDSPLIRLDTARIRGLGWEPKVGIRDAVVRTLDWFERNEYAWRDQLDKVDAPATD